MEKNMQPKLRFKEFSKKWEEKKYGDIYSFYSTNSLSRDKLNYENGNVKNIHYGDIHTKFSTMFDLREEKVPFINTDIDLSKVKEESFCKLGDLVIADASEDYADIGKTIEILNLDGIKTLAGLHTFLARPDKDEIYTGFMGNLLKSWKTKKQIMTIAQGSKVLSLSTTRLSKVKLNLPTSLPEQEKIASFLSSVDTKIEELEEKKELLGEYKKGIMQKIFSQEIRFKDENGEEYPQWEEKKLGEVVKFLDGKRKPLKDSDRASIQGIYPYYGASGIIDYINDYIFDEELILLGEDGANIVTRNSRLVFLATGKYWVNNHAHVMKANKDCNQYFICEYLETLNYIIYNTGTAQPKLNKEVCSKIKVKKPCLEEQEKIADFLTGIDQKIELVGKDIDGNKEFKKGLLQQMFV